MAYLRFCLAVFDIDLYVLPFPRVIKRLTHRTDPAEYLIRN